MKRALIEAVEFIAFGLAGAAVGIAACTALLLALKHWG